MSQIKRLSVPSWPGNKVDHDDIGGNVSPIISSFLFKASPSEEKNRGHSCHD